jgi:hypothetical protein
MIHQFTSVPGFLNNLFESSCHDWQIENFPHPETFSFSTYFGTKIKKLPVNRNSKTLFAFLFSFVNNQQQTNKESSIHVLSYFYNLGLSALTFQFYFRGVHYDW